MLENIAYYQILGKPLIMYLGIITLLSLSTTATLGLLMTKGRADLKVHKAFAITTLVLALTHGILGLLLYF